MQREFEGRILSSSLSGCYRVTYGSLIETVQAIPYDESLPVISAPMFETHIHGGSGFSVDGSLDGFLGTLNHTEQHGVSDTILSLVSSSAPETLAALSTAQPLLSRPGFHGLHLEGPFISTERCGAHNQSHLRSLADAELADLINEPALRSITVAPEQVSAEQVAQLVAAGKVVAIGHTNATYEEVREYFAAGASLLTHAFNAMRQIESREPGPVIAALEAGAWIELIADGIHVKPELARQLANWAGNKLILVSDSMAAAGMPDGTYQLGTVEVSVSAGTARRSDNGALAGSTLTLDLAVRNLVSWGVSEAAAISAATDNPRQCYGFTSASLESGAPADFLAWEKTPSGLKVSPIR